MIMEGLSDYAKATNNTLLLEKIEEVRKKNEASLKDNNAAKGRIHD